ncbi:MAG: hypothetical protein ACLGI6_14915 [Gammaproteobacteria bacterium]
MDMSPWVAALIAHGLLGGADIILNHELIAHLPRQVAARRELRLHSLRELAFALIFAGLAWYEWHGALAFVIIALFVSELWISTVDTVLELDTRRLPVTERILHVLMFVNLGVVMALLGRDMVGWIAQPTALVPARTGALAWVLSAQALLALGWCIRDALSYRRLGQSAAAPAHC